MYQVKAHTSKNVVSIEQLLKMVRHNNIVGYKTSTGYMILRRTRSKISDDRYAFVSTSNMNDAPTFHGANPSESILKAYRSERQLVLFSGPKELIEYL